MFVSGSRVSFSVVCHRVNGDLVRRAHSVSSLALSSRCPRVVILLILSLSFLCVVPIRLTRSCARRVSLFTARLARVPPARRRRHSHRGTARLGDFRCRGTLRSSTRRPLHNIINSNTPPGRVARIGSGLERVCISLRSIQVPCSRRVVRVCLGVRLW